MCVVEFLVSNLFPQGPIEIVLGKHPFANISADGGQDLIWDKLDARFPQQPDEEKLLHVPGQGLAVPVAVRARDAALQEPT